ncbi:DUF4347 domain-containing protein, partial [Marinobacterium litorale]|uniref:DUF4347 domain-containing protein n=1 Tax=Marinobacterium litorale TaxID=404770 RepID=UPI00056A6DD3
MSLPLYLIDKHLPDYTALIAALPEGADYHLLEPGQDGIDQLVSILGQYSDISALHLLSHAAPGELQLGSTRLTADTIDSYASQLSQLAGTFADGADLLLYGCNLADDEAGQALLAALGDQLGVDISASDDITGIDGDWTLEVTSGEVETKALNLSGYSNNLEAPGPQGTEFQVNTYTNSAQRDPSVTALADGGWLVTWQSFGSGIYGQRYAADGSTAGDEFQINTYTVSYQWLPSVTALTSVTALSDGGWLVTWTSWGQDGHGEGIYGQRYADDGSTLGDEFQINTYTYTGQLMPSATTLNDGGWLVTWTSEGQDGSGYGVYGQRYASDGSTIDDEFQINTDTNYDQAYPSVTALNDGGWLVTWHSGGQDGSGYGIYGQRYAADGSTAGDEFRINTFTNSDQIYPSVTALHDGGWLVTWHSGGQDGSDYGIYGQRYAADGSIYGDEFQINTYTASYQWRPSVTTLSDGGWLVTWSSSGQDGSNYGVYGQRYAADGTTRGDEFQINTYTFSIQSEPSIAALDDGGWLVTWQSYGQDGSHYGVYGQRYDANGNQVMVDNQAPQGSVEISGRTLEGNVLTAGHNLSDADGMGSVSYQWQADGVDLAGETGEQLTLTDAHIGQQIRVIARYTDQRGSSESVSSEATPAITADGSVGTEFQVNTYTANSQYTPSVTTLADGGWLVTWGSDGQDGSGYGIFGQRYAADGSTAGDEFRINTETNFYQEYPSVTALNDGGWLVTWESRGQDVLDYGVYGQRYAADGSASGGEFQINIYTVFNLSSPSVTALNDGGWLVTWRSWSLDSTYDSIHGQRYAADGSTEGDGFQISTDTNSSHASQSVTALNDGGWLVTWAFTSQTVSGYGIYGQRYAADGSAYGDEFQI